LDVCGSLVLSNLGINVVRDGSIVMYNCPNSVLVADVVREHCVLSVDADKSQHLDFQGALPFPPSFKLLLCLLLHPYLWSFAESDVSAL